MKEYAKIAFLLVGFFLSQLQCARCNVRGASSKKGPLLQQNPELVHQRRLATAPVDVLFIVDESDSMSEEQNDVRERVKEIFDQLPAGSAVGLVGYGRQSSIFAPRPGAPQVHTPLTTDSDRFQAAADNLQATGTYEPAYLALYQSVADDFSAPLGFRGTKFCSILITDEPSNGSGVTQTQTIDALKGGTDSGLESAFFGITIDGIVRQAYEGIAAATGGAMFRLEDFRRDPSFVLTPVLEACTVAVLDNILLDPAMETKIVGQSHTVSASVLKIVDESVIDAGVISDGIFDPQAGVQVTFDVLRGPNAGTSGFCTANTGCTTDNAGQLNFTYVGNGGVGVDEVEACFVDSVLGTNKCTTVLVEWIGTPTGAPSSGPTLTPSLRPSAAPVEAPTQTPSSPPSTLPTSAPSLNPTVAPSRNPTLPPSSSPSSAPSTAKSESPSSKPSSTPSMSPSLEPSMKPTLSPSVGPTALPSSMPTSEPSLRPSANPSLEPTVGPTLEPSWKPTAAPTVAPSSSSPTFMPSLRPSSAAPTMMPSTDPTLNPTTASPTTALPSEVPSSSPTDILCPLETDEDFVLDTVEFPGETRNCKWLQKPVGDRLAIYCNDPQSSALEDCPLTCGKCDPAQDPACEEEERNATFLRDVDGSQIVDPDETDPELINVRRCKWLVKGQDRIDEFCPRFTSTAAAVCPCHCALLDLFIPLFHIP